MSNAPSQADLGSSVAHLLHLVQVIGVNMVTGDSWEG